MKTIPESGRQTRFQMLVYLSVAVLAFARVGFSQVSVSPPTNCGIPEVTIWATDPTANWSGDPGIFTVLRTGNATPPLHVYYEISGTAGNGQDYHALGNWVDIPSGVFAADIVISPSNEVQATTRTVVLTLTNSPMLGAASGSMPVNYLIGNHNCDTVRIEPGAKSNLPPVVTVVYPPDGSIDYAPANIPMLACARDPDGKVTAVEYFANNVSLGVITNWSRILPAVTATLPPLPPMPPYQPFVLVWTNASPGTNIVIAKATDNEGASATSAPVHVVVVAGLPPPPTNISPIVRITTPPDGAVFRSPVDIPIFAYARAPGGSITAVGFFDGTNFIGSGRSIGPVVPAFSPGSVQPPIIVSVTNRYVLNWLAAPQGNHLLTAVALDDAGRTISSEPINITVLSPISETNHTTIVSIKAIDPIAVEGTNSWPWLGLAGTSLTWTNWAASNVVFRQFTRFGPKEALFAVYRRGDTNSDVTVAYAIGGTASNGVDDVALPGEATIPAGRSVVFIPLVPVDDGTSNRMKTVNLRLTPSTNTPSKYVLGFPCTAVAVIVDSDNPFFATGVLSDNTFHVNGTGPNGAWFHVEYVDDLVNARWTAVCTNQVVNGSIDFVDPDAPNTTVRFYRVVREDGAPQN